MTTKFKDFCENFLTEASDGDTAVMKEFDATTKFIDAQTDALKTSYRRKLANASNNRDNRGNKALIDKIRKIEVEYRKAIMALDKEMGSASLR